MADPVNEVVMEGKGKEEEEKKEQLAPGVELEETHCYGMTDQGEDIPADDEEEEEEVEENKEENGEENKPKKKKRGGRKKVKVDPRSKMEYLDESLEVPIVPDLGKIPHLISSERKMAAWAFYRSMGSPKRTCAPMVDQSELPFRMLTRKYDCDGCYTPMFHSFNFASSQNYRDGNFTTCPEDRPLWVQFCANDPNVFLAAARAVENYYVGQVDAIDLNLGCPQRIAKRGYYGAFLQESRELIFKLVRHLYTHLKVPITVKIRILDTEEETLQYARMIQEAGAHLLGVHGRTRVQKGQLAGHANWEMIRKIKEDLSIPVIANGSVERYEDVEECLKVSGADGVMSATGLLRNPALYSGKKIKEVDLAEEYIEFVGRYPTRNSAIKAHLYKIMQMTCNRDVNVTQMISKMREAKDFAPIAEDIRKRGADVFYNTDIDDSCWSFPSRHSKHQEGVEDHHVAGMGGLFEEA